MFNWYVAILTPTRREISSLYPKRLLLNIYNVLTGEEFRDHLWIQETDKLSKILSNNSKSNLKELILFEAKEIEYLSSTGTKKGFSKLKNIQKINIKELSDDLRLKFNKRFKRRKSKKIKG